MMEPHQLMLGQFMRAFEASLDPRLWIKLIKEETAEFEAELGPNGDKVNLLKESADVLYVMTAFDMLMEEGENLYLWLLNDDERSDWELTITKANRALKQAYTIFGPELLKTAFERVHQSNMSKLDEDGKPIRREDGKVLKGPLYQPPYLDDLLQ